MDTIKNINGIFNVIDRSLFTNVGGLDYDRITDALILLSNQVAEFEGDTDDIWYIGECGNCCLSDLIVGAYWHYSEWHGGQWSKGYAALSALGRVFSPNMSGIEEENEAYIMLNQMASELEGVA